MAKEDRETDGGSEKDELRDEIGNVNKKLKASADGETGKGISDLLDTVDGFPLLIKLLLCIPAVDIFYSVCRALRGYVKGDIVWLVIGILTVIPGAAFMWIVDVVWVLLKGHAFMLGDTYLA